jgi:hypothetical protein
LFCFGALFLGFSFCFLFFGLTLAEIGIALSERFGRGWRSTLPESLEAQVPV